ncbi:hypothetical protein [Paludibaculum fermentans]|uniref:hypothetical protein n=1 Tax=Paludibaculum fermentans TaxID=1473598 RepID=UPI003EB9CDE4
MTLFRILGIGTVLYSAVFFGMVALSMQGARIRAEELRPALIPGIFFLIVGIGLLLQRNWAVVLFCVCGFGFGGGLIAVSLIKVEFPWLLINLCIGGALISVSIAAVRRLLKLRRRAVR